MYFLIIFILLALSIATLFLAKSHPSFKPVGVILPIVAILIFIFKPGSPSAIPVSQQVLNEEARSVGEQLARSITGALPQTGVILVVHPDEQSPAYANSRIQKQLQGLEEGLASSGYTMISHALVQADAVDDPLTDGTYIGSQTLKKLSADRQNPSGIVLLGLQFGIGDEKPSPTLPPLILASIGDPGTSQLALDRGIAVAALFEKTEAPLYSIKDRSLTAKERFNLRFEIRTSDR